MKKKCLCRSPKRHRDCQYCGSAFVGDVVCGICKEAGIDGKLIRGTGRVVCAAHKKEKKMQDMNHCELGYVVVVRDRGQDEPRITNRIYPDHPSAICVKHNLQLTGRYNSVSVREATPEDVKRCEGY